MRNASVIPVALLGLLACATALVQPRLLQQANTTVSTEQTCLREQANFIRDLTTGIQSSVQAITDNGTTTCSDAISSALDFTQTAQALTAVLNACGGGGSAVNTTNTLRPIKVMAIDADYAVGQAQEYTANVGWQVDITVKYGNSDLDTFLALQSQNTSEKPLASYDGFIFRPDRLAALSSQGILMPLDDLLASPEGVPFKWQDIYLNLRQSAVRYNGKVMAVPLGVWPFMMSVRKDWLGEAQRLLGEPTGWYRDNILTHEGVLRVAEALQRQNYDYSVAPNGYRNSSFPSNRRPVCFHQAYPFFDSSDNPAISNEAFLMHLLATMTQTQGPTQGWLFDHTTGLPFVNTEAMRTALRLWLRYMAVSVIQPVGPEGAASCAIIFSSMEVFKNLTSYDTYVRSQIFIPEQSMPGSTVYYDRSTGTMQPCTATTCSTTSELIRDRSTIHYNMVGGAASRRAYLMGISNLSPRPYQLQLWDLMTFLSLTTFQLAYYRDLDVNAVRAPDLTNFAAYTADPTQPNWTMEEWTAFRYMCELSILDYPNYMEEDRTLLTTKTVTSWHVHAGALYDAVSATAVRYPPPSSPTPTPARPNTSRAGRRSMQTAVTTRARERSLFMVYPVTSMPDGVNPSVHDALINKTMADLMNDYMNIINSSTGGLQQFKVDYLASLNRPATGTLITPGGSTPTVTGERVTGSLTSGQKAAIIATPTVVVTLLLAVLLFALGKVRRSQHRSLFGGAILAPGPGPNTSLLITDIESSTTFWEVLPPEIMDQSIAVHHNVMRTCAQKHRCYESATEGDSFLISAHSAEDAVRCALAVQKALLEAPWPPALLGQPLCQPRWASPNALPISMRNLMGLAMGQSIMGAVNSKDEEVQEETTAWWCWGQPKPKKAVTSLTTAGSGTLDGEDLLTRAGPAGSMLAPGPPAFLQSYPLQVQLAQAAVRGMASSAGGMAGDSNTGGNAPRRRSLLGLPLPMGGGHHAVAGEGGSARRRSFMGLGSAAGGGDGVLILRGLRVRMGVHTGVQSTTQVAFNQAAGRTQYSGEFLTLAKLIQDAAQGGQILATEGCFNQLAKEQLRSEVTLAHMGHHVLKDGWEPVSVYCALTYPTLLMRAGVLGPVRSVKQTSAGFLQAPTGTATVCFMTAMSVSALMSWNPEITRASLDLYQKIAQQMLWKMGGYAVEVAEGLVLAALASPTAALHWATAVMEACLDADWPEELLEQELCEEISVTAHNAALGPGASGGSFAFPGAPGTVLVGLSAGEGAGTAAGEMVGKARARKRGLSGVAESQADGGDGDDMDAGPDTPPATLAPTAAPTLADGEAGAEHTPPPVSQPVVASLLVDRLVAGGPGRKLPGAMPKPLRLLRGLRIKCGIDIGGVSVSLNETTGLVQFKGKVMNRAARICSVAKTGQTWCSETVWSAHLEEEDMQMRTYQLHNLHSAQSDELTRLVKGTSSQGSKPPVDSSISSAGKATATAAPTDAALPAPLPDTPRADVVVTIDPPPMTAAALAAGAANQAAIRPCQVEGATRHSPNPSGPPSGEEPAADVTLSLLAATGPTQTTPAPPTVPANKAPPAQAVSKPAVVAHAAHGSHDSGVSHEWWGQGAGPHGEDCVLAGVPLGPHRLKGILDEMHLMQVRRLVLDN